MQIITNDRLDQGTEPANGTVTTKGGKQVAADLVIWATGSKPNTQWLQGGQLQGSLEPNGRIKVSWPRHCKFKVLQ